MNRLLAASRLPKVPRLEGFDSDVADYLRALAVALEEWRRDDVASLKALDTPPVLSATLATNQALTANVLTTLLFDSVTDPRGWYSAGVYTPKQAGFYRCSWGVGFHDTAAIATSTYGYSQLGGRVAIAYGNGAALDTATTSGSVIVECDSTTQIKVQALILAGTAPVAFAGRCWLDIDYLGKR